MNAYPVLTSGQFQLGVTSATFQFTLTRATAVMIEVGGDSGVSKIYNDQMKALAPTTNGRPLILEAGTYIVQASFSSPNQSVISAYFTDDASYAALPKLASGAYKASTWDHFYALEITHAGSMFLVPSGDSGQVVVFDLNLNFVAHGGADPLRLEPGKYIVYASYGSYTNGMLTAAIPPQLQQAGGVVPTQVLDDNDVFIGSDWDDLVQGLAGADSFTGFYSSRNPDIFFGGSGVDSSHYRGKFSDYTISQTVVFPDLRKPAGAFVNGMEVIDKTSYRDGKDWLHDVERLHFSDISVAFDINGNAGQAYRLYNAAFDRVPDSNGLGYWIAALDRGTSLADIAQAFVSSAEFASAYAAATTNSAIVSQFYANILGRVPDAPGHVYWTSVLDNKIASVAEVLRGFSESPENSKMVEIEIIGGIHYTLFGV